MTITQFLIMAIVAGVATIPSVLLIPRARQSPSFDRVLWFATYALAFLGAWLVPSYLPTDWPLNSWVIGDLVLVPAAIGAVAGALSINGLLWLMDRFGGSSMVENMTEAVEQTEEQDGGTNSGNSNKHPR